MQKWKVLMVHGIQKENVKANALVKFNFDP